MDQKINFFTLYWGNRLLPKKYGIMKGNFINKDKHTLNAKSKNWFDDINY